MLAAALAFVVAAGALVATHHTVRAPINSRLAVRDALAYPPLQLDLAGVHWDSVRADPLDSRLERVVFFARGRAVGEVAVNRAGVVSQEFSMRRLTVPYGGWLAYEPAVMVGLAALFALMCWVRPWRRLRNLDVIAALSLLAPVILLRERYLEMSVLSAVPGLVYLMARCMRVALMAPSRPAGQTPLWTSLTATLAPAARVRLLRLLVAALAVVFLCVGVSSNSPVDVIYAVMEGATRILHGVLPYGHMPGDVVHGDTYPLLSYGLYVPLAFVSPVSSTWDSVDLALGAAVAAALAAGFAIRALTLDTRQARPRARTSRPSAETEAGLRAVLAWLAFPPLLIAVSTGTTDVMLAAFVVIAVAVWGRPTLAAGVLSAAAWFKVVPAALLPLALAPLRGRRLARALVAVAAVSAPMLALLLALAGPRGLGLMLHAISFQLTRGSLQSLWAVLGLRLLQPLGQAAVVALIVGSAVRVAGDPELAADRRRIAALAAAILIGLELTASYWAFLYLVWVVPLLCVSLLGQPAAAEERVRARLRVSYGALAEVG